MMTKLILLLMVTATMALDDEFFGETCYGTELHRLTNVASSNDCRDLCRRHCERGCRFFTYEPSTRFCKTFKSCRRYDCPNGRCISAEISCPGHMYNEDNKPISRPERYASGSGSYGSGSYGSGSHGSGSYGSGSYGSGGQGSGSYGSGSYGSGGHGSGSYGSGSGGHGGHGSWDSSGGSGSFGSGVNVNPGILTIMLATASLLFRA